MSEPAASRAGASGAAQPPNLKIWPSTPHSGVGRSHGTSRNVAFDRWFRYPAGFATDYATYLLSRLGLGAGQTVVDCFTGSGVTGTAARAAGFAFAGIEAHPMIAELAQLKLTWTLDGGQLRHAAQTISEVAAQQLAGSPVADPTAAETDLVERSFSVEVVSVLIALRDAVQAHDDDEVAAYLKWALLGCLRDVASVKVGWPYQRPGLARQPRFTDTMQRFIRRVSFIADDIDAVAPTALSRKVMCGDSRDRQVWDALMDGQLAHGCVASPPYLNNFDYADATRLEAYFWGEARTWGELCSHIRADMLTATTQQSSVGEAQSSLDSLQETPVGPEMIRLTGELRQQRRSRRRGKEYDQVMPAYFAAMNDVLQNLAAHLAPGAPVAWLIGDSAPYGVYVDTPRLIGELGASVGLAVEADVVLRERGNRWAKLEGRHNNPLAERLLILRKS